MSKIGEKRECRRKRRFPACSNLVSNEERRAFSTKSNHLRKGYTPSQVEPPSLVPHQQGPRLHKPRSSQGPPTSRVTCHSTSCTSWSRIDNPSRVRCSSKGRTTRRCSCQMRAGRRKRTSCVRLIQGRSPTSDGRKRVERSGSKRWRLPSVVGERERLVNVDGNACGRSVRPSDLCNDATNTDNP